MLGNENETALSMSTTCSCPLYQKRRRTPSNEKDHKIATNHSGTKWRDLEHCEEFFKKTWIEEENEGKEGRDESHGEEHENGGDRKEPCPSFEGDGSRCRRE